MLDIFHGLRLVVKKRSINIDNAIFRCHWFFTSTLLVSFSVIITARQYVGQPIECHSTNKLPESLLNSYCWVQGTFTVPQACNLQPGLEVPFPCIDNTRGRDIKIYAYYQWVGMVLFIQGLMFHFPYYLWKVWENGLISAITSGLRVALLTDQELAKKRAIVVEYIYDHLGCHRSYAYKYFLCEFICLLNLLAQLWCVNRFFDGQFLRYGLDVMQFGSQQTHSVSYNVSPAKQQSTNSNQSAVSNMSSMYLLSTTAPLAMSNPNTSQISARLMTVQSSNRHSQPIDPMSFIFPRMTKCTYYDFGSSGDVQKHDALCLLPLNIINEKIYISLWFWFFILAILTLLVIIYRLFAFFSIGIRCRGLISRCKLSNERDIRVICMNCDVGDWFLFYMVAENLDPIVMREIVASISQKIRDSYGLKRIPSKDQDNPDDGSFSFDQPEIWLTNGERSSRRNSNTDSARVELEEPTKTPLMQKIKKKLYSKRLWSMDLGSGEARQRLFEQSVASSSRNDEAHMAGQFSAPPASQMALESIPPRLSSCLNPIQRLRQIHRRGSLTRSTSIGSAGNESSLQANTMTKSICDSFVMEIQNISGDSNYASGTGANGISVQRRRRESVGSIHRLHQQRQSIDSMRDFDLERQSGQSKPTQ